MFPETGFLFFLFVWSFLPPRRSREDEPVGHGSASISSHAEHFVLALTPLKIAGIRPCFLSSGFPVKHECLNTARRLFFCVMRSALVIHVSQTAVAL